MKMCSIDGQFSLEMFTCASVSWQELYQKLTDYDIRFYMYELLKVRGFTLRSVFLPSESKA